MKLYKAVLMVLGMLAISGLGLVEYSYSANLGLLVNNSASLDAEEQAAYDFASSHGFTVTKLDPPMIQNDPSVLNNFDGFWADNGSIPTGFNNQAVIQPLLNAINSGKGILFRQYGGFIGQYLGLGTATSGFWCPVYADAEYFVQALDDHPVFDGIPTWLDHALPNKPEQLIYRVNAGCKTGAGIDLTNAQVFDIVKIVEAWSPDGHDVQQGGYVFEKSVGQGIALFLPINGFTLGTLGPVGEKMYTNALNYICSSGQLPLSAPTLLQPAAESDFYIDSPIYFQWSRVDWATNYTIEISDGQETSAAVLNGRPRGTFTSIIAIIPLGNEESWTAVAGFLARGTYYWHVMASCDTVDGVFSATRRFSVAIPEAMTDWPMYCRDAGRTAYTPVEVRPPLKRSWNESSFDAGGAVRASVVVVGDTVFMANCVGKVYALSAATKSIYWQKPLNSNMQVWASPVYAGGRLFVTGTFANYGTGAVYCLNSSSGDIIWGPKNFGNSLMTAPTVVGDKLLVPNGDYSTQVLAISNGEFLTGIDGGRWSTAAVWNGKAYFSTSSLNCYDPTTGQVTQIVSGTFPSPVAISPDGHAFFAGPGRGLASFNLVTNQYDWTGGIAYIQSGPIPRQFAICDDYVITTYGSGVYALNRTNGAVVWTTGGSGGTMDYQSPIIAGNTVLFTKYYGYLDCVDLHTGDLLEGHQEVASYCYDSPVAAKDKIFVGLDNGQLYAFETGTPTQAQMTVTCFNDANGDGLRGGYELPLAGWTVSLSNGISGVTNANGSVSFTLAYGDYTLTVSALPGFICTTGDNPQQIRVFLYGNNNFLMGFQKAPVLTFTPSTFGPLAPNQTVQFGVNLAGMGSPLAGKTVLIMDHSVPSLPPGQLASLTTDQNGNATYTYQTANYNENPEIPLIFVAKFTGDTEWGPAADTSYGNIAPNYFTIVLDDPANNANVTLPHTFRWYGSYATGEVNYTIQFAQNNNFTSPAYTASLTTSEINASIEIPTDVLTSGQTYQWRVRAERQGKEPVTSEVRSCVIQNIVGTLPPPQLVSPEDGALLDPHFHDIRFEWQAVAGAQRYMLQIADGTDFANVLITRTMMSGATTEITLSDEEAGVLSWGEIYYWRMATFDGTAWGMWSDLRTLRCGPPAPNLAFPDDATNLCLHIPLTFQWGAVSGCDQYQIQIDNNTNFNSVDRIDTTISDYKLTVFPPHFKECKYYWRVRSSANGTWGSYTETQSFNARDMNTVWGQVFDAHTKGVIESGHIESWVLGDQNNDIVTSANTGSSLLTDGYYGLYIPNDVEYKRIWITCTDLTNQYNPVRLIDSCVQTNSAVKKNFYLIPRGGEDLETYEVFVNREAESGRKIVAVTYNDNIFDDDYKVAIFSHNGDAYLGSVPQFTYELVKAIQYTASRFNTLGLRTWAEWEQFSPICPDYKIEINKTVPGGADAATPVVQADCFHAIYKNNYGYSNPISTYCRMKSVVAHELEHDIIGVVENNLFAGTLAEAMCQWTRNAVYHSNFYQKQEFGGLVYWANQTEWGTIPVGVFENPELSFWSDLIYGYFRSALLLQYFCDLYGSQQILTDEWGREYYVYGNNYIGHHGDPLPEEVPIPDSVYHDFAITNLVKKNYPFVRYNYREYNNLLADVNLKYGITVWKGMGTVISVPLDTLCPGGSQYIVIRIDKSNPIDRLLLEVTWHTSQLPLGGYYLRNSIVEFSGENKTIHENTLSWSRGFNFVPDSLVLVTTGFVGTFGSSRAWPLSVRIIVDPAVSGTLFCPLDLQLVGPNGQICTRDSSNISEAIYSTVSGTTGNRLHTSIALADIPKGEWRFVPVPEINATPESTFSLYFWTPTDSLYLARNMRVGDIPVGGFAFYAEPYASFEGSVRDSNGAGLLGVNLDILDFNGNLWKTLVTDNSGCYQIDSIPNGNYFVSVVTPLGYQADQETKEFTINHVPVRVDFSLTKLAITPRPRTQAYWAHQLEKALQNKPDDYTKRDFSRFVGLINLHFNQNQVNPVDFYTVTQPANQQDSLMALKRLLNMCQGGEPLLKRLAKAQLMALMLNVVSGKISQTQVISRDGRTVSQTVTYCDMLVNDEIDCPDNVPGHSSPLCPYILADFILTFANLGLTVPNNMIPADIIQIAYSIHNHENLPTGFALHQNYPNPFNPICEIEYDLPAECHVTLSVYNILGQKVKVLVDENQSAGRKSAKWDSKDEQGQEVTSGVYFYRIQAGNFVQSKKMILMK